MNERDNSTFKPNLPLTSPLNTYSIFAIERRFFQDSLQRTLPYTLLPKVITSDYIDDSSVRQSSGPGELRFEIGISGVSMQVGGGGWTAISGKVR